MTSTIKAPKQLAEGITGSWLPVLAGEHCSVCFTVNRVLRLSFGYDTIRVCALCGVALRELLVDALEDEDQ